MRVTLQLPFRIIPLENLVAAFNEGCTISEEAVCALNASQPVSASEGDISDFDEDDGKPLDFSHLMRASLWLSHYRTNYPLFQQMRTYYKLAKRDVFDEQQHSIFVGEDANEDAMDLF
uniref:Uncharacterized protein n=1 Tax=Chromera velia CCMP2878 TaxID=1169474 RepID=A0A0G4I5C9_9ALVE|eukprot:Cvel_11140.t1-p1 / transcript=Cvel_11140.t1 / gene=Cvel_11140 / organism=Chromera_velia_CCMP2878 / gene_product=hypothetical protein / transcript_product=hypothetical protein / location=Cvel_scaffold690:64845-65195(-) / protein_length=117 / sequence_SO=supercontig / SO=protein_coding / is_pseudo=false